jgi:hypothetical protein
MRSQNVGSRPKRTASQRDQASHPSVHGEGNKGKPTAHNAPVTAQSFEVTRCKFSGECPVCGKPKLDVTRKPAGRPGPPWWIQCFACPDGTEYTAALREVVGVPYSLIAEDPLTHLGPWLDRPRKVTDAPAPPSAETVQGWHSALLSSSEPLSYLTERRGLTLDTLRRACVGWDRDCGDLTFPAFADDRIVYLYRRKPLDGASMIAMGGPRPIYPDLPGGALALVAGEIDALTGRQIGLNAVTVSGRSLPNHTVHRFVGRTVYVCFDVGEEREAKRAAQKLGAAGIRSYVVDLAELGLPDKGDLNDYVRNGGTKSAVVDLIRRARG